MEPAAEQNCSDLIARATTLAPLDVEVQLTLASIRMSQSRVDEARQVLEGVYERLKEMEACESSISDLTEHQAKISLTTSSIITYSTPPRQATIGT